MSNADRDLDWWSTKIVKVDEYEDDFTIQEESGWSLGISKEYGETPRVGDDISFCGRIGFPIRGIKLRGKTLFYRTEEEEDARIAKAREERLAKMRAEWENKKPKYDARVEKLPEVMRERFRILRRSERFWEFEAYELSCCEDAAKMVAHVNGDIDNLLGLFEAGPESDTGKALGLFDGHSGNSWGFACRMARFLIESPEVIPRFHGALCNLVGCEDFGCPVHQEKMARGE